MPFDYCWKNQEANFGPPLKTPVNQGTHITIEIILKKNDKYVALRRPEAIPGHEHPPKTKTKNGLLYFCHNLIRFSESFDKCINRIVKSQSGVSVKSFRVAAIESFFQKKDNQWAFMPYVIAELSRLPKAGRHGNLITEVVLFNKGSIPNDFGWWTINELKEFLREHD